MRKRGGRGGERTPRSDALVVGRRPALEAVRSGSAREVLIAVGTRGREIDALEQAAREAGVRTRRVPESTMGRLGLGVRHQGVAARVTSPKELGEADLAEREWGERAIAVVLDGVTDPHNVGAVARTAEAAGASAIVLRKARGAGVTPAAIKTSSGALLFLPVARVANISRALERLKRAGFWVVGFDERADLTIDDAEPPTGRLALVLGSEGTGLSRLVRETCDELLSIPMRGRVASLNVSVAAGVGLFGYALRGSWGEREASGGRKREKKG